MPLDIVETEIPVHELRIGMHVIRLDRPWEETDFLLQGFVIKSEAEIDALRTQCQRVMIEGKVKRPVEAPKAHHQRQVSKPTLFQIIAGKSRDEGHSSAARKSNGKAMPHVPKARVTYINKVNLSHEIHHARDSYQQAKDMANAIMGGIRVGRALDLNRAREVVDQCVDSLLRNDDALLWLTKLKHKDEYTAEHSINVSILSAALGKQLGMLEGEIRTLGLCGLLHDVGKVKIPDLILMKPGALEPEEYAEMRNHCNHGRDILMSMPRVVHAAVDVAYNHHERLDGKGYPRGLMADQIPHLAKIVAIVDTYDAITSARVYDRARSSMEALEIIYRMRGTQFDTDLANVFIRMIGIYPPGSIVEMTNGEVGIVVAANPRNKRRPKVILVRDMQKQPRAKMRVVDMSRNVKDLDGEEYLIAKEVPDKTYGISLQQFLDDGLVLGHQTVDEISV